MSEAPQTNALPARIAELCSAPPPGREESPVCMHRGRAVPFAAFQAAVAACAADLAKHSEQRWCLHSESSYVFAVGLFAGLHSGKTLVLPANSRAGTLERLRGRYDGVLSDAAQQAAAELPYCCPLAPETAQHGPPAPFDSSRAALQLFTSGSTGEQKCIEKTAANFEAEVRVLEAKFGRHIAGCTIVSTVPHQHIYGLLYKILWPLLAGRPFVDETAFYPDALASAISEHRSVGLISSPAHLKRFCEINTPLPGACCALFSSGGLLPESVSAAAHSYLGASPVEVLGSTETGGVAWRRQLEGGEPWRLMPGVELQISAGDGRMSVRSTFTGPGQEKLWIRMGDGARKLADGAFELLGRQDRIIKVEDRRFSPADMELQLAAHPFVDEAAVLVLDGAVHRCARDLVAAAVSPSVVGRSVLRERGRKAFGELLKSHLAAYFESVLLPKRWRFVFGLPADERGKRPLAELEKLFRPSPVRCIEPEVLEVVLGSSEAALSLRVPAALEYFPGHFPQQHIVPGFVQLQWVLQFARRCFTPLGRTCSLEALKFQNVLLPDDLFELQLSWASDKNKVSFLLASEKKPHASGRISFYKD